MDIRWRTFPPIAKRSGGLTMGLAFAALVLWLASYRLPSRQHATPHWLDSVQMSQQQFLMTFPPRNGGTFNQMHNIRKALLAAQSTNRAFILPPLVAGKHFDAALQAQLRGWSDFLDFAPLSEHLKIPILDLQPILDRKQHRQLLFGPEGSAIDCHNVAGNEAVEFAGSIANIHETLVVLSAMDRQLNITRAYDPSVFPSAPGELSFDQVGSLIRQDPPLSCFVSFWHALNDFPIDPSFDALLDYQLWLKAASSLFLVSTARGISGSWADRLTAISGQAVSPDQVAETLKKIDPTHWFEATPQFVGVHWRRGDFEEYCAGKGSPAGCFPEVEIAMATVKKTRQANCNSPLCPVVVASNTRNAAEIDSFSRAGFALLDHVELQTRDQLGAFAGVFVDLAILESQSAAAFVGNRYSTFSGWVLRRRQVRGWPGNVRF